MTEDAYAARADALKEKLYGMAWLYLGSQSLAVDAVDEAVYRGLRSCGKLREEQYFDTWLTRILINVCHAELRRHRRRWPWPSSRRRPRRNLTPSPSGTRWDGSPGTYVRSSPGAKFRA